MWFSNARPTPHWGRPLQLALFGVVFLAIAVDAEQPSLWRAQSERGSLQATLAPRDGPVAIGAFQPWILSLNTMMGSPLEQARIAVGGGMPGHGHGLPTQPVVTDYLGDGRYLVEGLKFSMAGQWIVALAVDSPQGQDRFAFNINLGVLSDKDLETLSSLLLTAADRPPPSTSNRVADNPNAAKLGEALFFDERLSADGSLSCGSCHRPDLFFTDGKPRAIGIRRAGRNTPTVIGAAYLPWLYWDGRRDSLWAQALVPFEAADEMGSSRVAVVRIVMSDPSYRRAYERVFGALPAETILENIPAHAGPLGDTETRRAWQKIDPDTAHAINVVYANLGKAIAAYQRRLPVPVSKFDRYVTARMAGDDVDGLMTSEELAGLKLFLDADRTHCLRCHNGPWFTNGGFHNIGTGTFTGAELDFGRVFGVRSVLMDEFNCLGRYSDAPPDGCTQLRFLNRNSHVPLEGAFKVPSLRNLEATAPYMHDGRFADLEAVLEFYRSPPNQSQVGAHELPPLDIDDAEAAQILAFLRTLKGSPIGSRQ